MPADHIATQYELWQWFAKFHTYGPFSVRQNSVTESVEPGKFVLSTKWLHALGHVPKLDDQSSRAWLYGKLFVALLSEKLAHAGRAISPWGYALPGETATQKPRAIR